MADQRLTSQERKDEIIQASLSILHHKGFSQLTLRQLGKNIGVSEAAVYRHFRNKEEIIQQLMTVVFQAPPGKTPKQDDSPSVMQRLREVMFAQLDILEKNPYITSVLFQDEIFREFPAIREQFDQHRDEMSARIVNIVKQGQRERVWRSTVNPQVFVVLFTGSMRQMVSTWRANNFSHSLSNLAEEVFTELVRLLEPDKGIVEESNKLN